jgi:hypothetical protein
MAQIIDWQTGAGLVSFTVTKQAMAADGTLSDSGSALDVRASLEEFGHSVGVETEQIRPIWSVVQNEVYISSGNRGRIVTLNRTQSAAHLSSIAETHSNGYVKLAWTESKEQYVGYFKVGDYEGGLRGHGRQVKSLMLLPCDPTNVAQVTRTVLP